MTTSPVAPETTTPAISPDHILQTGLAFWASKTLLSAVEMEVFTELARGPETLEALTGRLGLHPRSSRDFLDALVALGFLQRENGQYRNTPSSRCIPRQAQAVLYRRHPRDGQRAASIAIGVTSPTALRTGETQNEANPAKSSPVRALYADPARLKGFLRAMTGVSRGANMGIAAKFPWDKYKTVADCGTAQGDLIVQVALKNPHLTGIGFDLPEVAPDLRGVRRSQRPLLHASRFQPGSFFTEPLPKADVIMMGHILHDWNLEQKKMLVRKAYEALPEGGAFIAYDSIIDDDRSKNAFGLLMSLNMLIETPGGFDYTGADCIGWMKEAGFRETRVEHLVGPDSMVIGIK